MNAPQDKWAQFLNTSRRKKEGAQQDTSSSTETRTEIERDYDRILFSTPVRRLADKTQVFPLDRNDSVRTRLTHSHEVSNLARSIGTTLAFNHSLAKEIPDSQRNIPALLAATGLAHDIGNPPFGHQGEAAIRSWFNDNKALLTSCALTKQQQNDFLEFEGNAQGFRLLTRLQLLNDDFGLDLTYATLAALMKYPVGSDKIDKKIASRKKYGYFYSEQKIAKSVLDKAGLGDGIRHPLAYIMEASDDIAYVTLDAEDAVKKGLASFSDLISFLEHHGGSDAVVKEVISGAQSKHSEYRLLGSLSPHELNDVSMQRFRVFAIGALVRSAVEAFMDHRENICSGNLSISLLEASQGETLRKWLKEFSLRHAYTHRSVLKVELIGYNVIRRLMDIFWDAISNREDQSNVKSKRNHPYSKFVYGLISENYKRVFENPPSDVAEMPIRYREFQLLTDMISGMTDTYAINLRDELDSLAETHKPIHS